MSFFRKFFSLLVLVLALGLFAYTRSIPKAPCEAPLAFTIGTVDSGFNLSRAELLRDVETASHIWENAGGKNYFEYEEEAKPLGKFEKFVRENLGRYFTRQPIVINLIYDERQQNADRQRVLISAIDDTKQTADEIRRRFTSLQADYERAKVEYEAMLSEYKKRRSDFATLEQKRLEVNSLADQTNALVKKYNYLVNSVNSTIQTFNKTAGEEFEEGQYVYDSAGERINIYEFGSREILRRVLAHELGHALGLDHNDNPASIMYYLNSSKNIVPTGEDVAGLRGVCKGE